MAVLALYCRFGLRIGILYRVIRISIKIKQTKIALRKIYFYSQNINNITLEFGEDCFYQRRDIATEVSEQGS